MEGVGWEGQNSALRVVEPYYEEECVYLSNKKIFIGRI